MQYVELGRTGLNVSRLCIGTLGFAEGDGWKTTREDAVKILEKAIDLGINFFDSADSYHNGKAEEMLGQCIVGRRDEIVISTKVFFPTGPGINDSGLSRKHLRRSAMKSLERLRTDYIDLYVMHRWDNKTPVEDVLKTLHDLVHSDNCVNHLGASSMWTWQFARALYTSDRLGLERFVTMQNHYNLCYREEEREMIPLCNAEGVAIIPWSPLARGFLTGKYKREDTPDGPRYERDEWLREAYFHPTDFDILERVIAIAEEKGATPAQIAIAWLLAKKEVASPIVGVTKISHLEDVVGALDIKLSPDDLKRLEEPYKPRSVFGHH